MKKLLAILGILVLFAGGYLLWAFKFRTGTKKEKGPEPIPLTVSKHSDSFNHSAEAVLVNYYAMTEAFVKWDSTEVNESAVKLQAALNELKLEELQKDAMIYESALDPLGNAKQLVGSILSEPSLDQKRVALNSLSENLMLLMVTIKYDRGKIYWQECPMAFNDEESGFWLSRTDAVRNPYLGLHHPKYRATMLECGGPKDTINFTNQSEPLIPKSL